MLLVSGRGSGPGGLVQAASKRSMSGPTRTESAARSCGEHLPDTRDAVHDLGQTC
jgi:hypothetical protein